MHSNLYDEYQLYINSMTNLRTNKPLRIETLVLIPGSVGEMQIWILCPLIKWPVDVMYIF